MLFAAPAGAVDLSEAALLEPEALAERLGIDGTAEAAVLVVADQDLDRLVIGLREVVLAPVEDGSRFLRLVRGQVDGILPVRVERGDLLWEGEIRTLAGRVTVFDAGEALASDKAQGLARDRALRGFDLWGFFADLEALPTLEERRAHCQAVQDELGAGPDRGLVIQACANVATLSSPVAPTVAQDEDAGGDVGDVDTDDVVVAPVAPATPSAERDPILYRSNGLSRRVPRGTFSRLGVAAGGLLLTGVFTGQAFDREIAAEEQWVLYRDAERVGDDLLVSQHLYDTKILDNQRDAAITTASIGLATAVGMAVWQGLEQRAFRKAKAAPALSLGVAPTRGGFTVALSLELDR